MSELCTRLHHLSRTRMVHQHPIDTDRVPRNGIYLVFENGERGHGGDRIVRVGTHTGHNQLRSRLREHFIRENKDRSIFRKNIGRALLASLDDPYFETWNLDLTTRDAKARYGRRIDTDRQAAIERRVTEYIQGHFRVVLIEVDAKDARLRLESRLISTVSLCQECRPSSGWLGLHSPKRKISDSGLWAVNELYKEPLSSRELEQLERTGGGQQS